MKLRQFPLFCFILKFKLLKIHGAFLAQHGRIYVTLRQAEGKRRAFVRLAFNFKLALHYINKVFSNAQAKARAFNLAVGFQIKAGIILKQPFHLIFGHAAPGITNA